jgi:excisionase family DNA binding protein
MKQSYSTKELAQMLDVSESTVKRWADAGLLKCRKTLGGHRKFHFDDVIEFKSSCGLALTDETIAERDKELDDLMAGPDFTRLAERYKEASLAGQFGCASAMLKEAHRRGHTLATLGDQVISPAMSAIGEMWRAGKIGVLDEHTATFATVQALMQLQMPIPEAERSEKIALVGCAEGEFHHLAALIACNLLESEGWKSIYLGQHTPVFVFAEALVRLKAELACISITMTDNIERAARDYEGLRRAASKQEAKIILGGAALEDDQVRARFRGALYAATLEEFLSLIK